MDQWTFPPESNQGQTSYHCVSLSLAVPGIAGQCVNDVSRIARSVLHVVALKRGCAAGASNRPLHGLRVAIMVLLGRCRCL